MKEKKMKDDDADYNEWMAQRRSL